MINVPQIENCRRDGHYNFMDGLRQRWVKDHWWCFFFLLPIGLRVLQKRKQTATTAWDLNHRYLAFLMSVHHQRWVKGQKKKHQWF